MKHFTFIMAFIFSLTPVYSFSQTKTEELTTQEQKDAIQKQDNNMINAAYVVAQMVDNNELVDLWEGISPKIRQILPQDEFVSQLQERRKSLGIVESRLSPLVSRTKITANQDIPEGIYISVQFSSRVSNQKENINELISFRLDEDNIWRVSGYSIK